MNYCTVSHKFFNKIYIGLSDHLHDNLGHPQVTISTREEGCSANNFSLMSNNIDMCFI